MRVVAIAVALVIAVGVSEVAANVCTAAPAVAGGHCLTWNHFTTYRSTSADAVNLRTTYHNWQNAANLGARPLGQLTWPGSHDAGAFFFDHNFGYTAPTPFGWETGSSSITQRYSLLDQACMGARFFDLRVGKTLTGQRRVVHPVAVKKLSGKATNSFFDEWDNALEQLRCFAQENPTELIFLRLKFVSFTSAQLLTEAQNIVTFFGNMIVQPGHVLAAGETDSDLRSKLYNTVVAAGRNVVLMAYPDNAAAGALSAVMTPSQVAAANPLCAVLDANFWNYRLVQDGEFSSSNDLAGVAHGQIQRTTAWQASPRHTMHGFWWTATCIKPFLNNLNVNKNTRTLYPGGARAPSPVAGQNFVPIPKDNLPLKRVRDAVKLASAGLNDKCLGNVLIIDFVGDERRFYYDSIMELVTASNTKGYCHPNHHWPPPLPAHPPPVHAPVAPVHGGPVAPVHGGPVAPAHGAPVHGPVAPVHGAPVHGPVAPVHPPIPPLNLAGLHGAGYGVHAPPAGSALLQRNPVRARNGGKRL